MGIVGDMNKFTQFQFANSMETAAATGGHSMATDAMGMGMGMNMANQMMNQNQQNQNQQQNQQQQQQSGAGAGAPPPIPGQEPMFVAINGQQQGPYPISNLGLMIQQGQVAAESLVWKNGMAAWTPASQVPELSGFFGSVPPPIPNL